VVVTNNVTVEQREKLVAIGLDGAIDALVTSEDVGAQKPSPAIFAAALDAAGAGRSRGGDARRCVDGGRRRRTVRRACAPCGSIAPAPLRLESGVPELRAFEPLERGARDAADLNHQAIKPSGHQAQF
jgi:putative hydrolase of the HAD superfamily